VHDVHDVHDIYIYIYIYIIFCRSVSFHLSVTIFKFLLLGLYIKSRQEHVFFQSCKHTFNFTYFFQAAIVLLAVLVSMVSGAAFPGSRPFPDGPMPKETLTGSESVYYPYAYYPAYYPVLYWG